MNATSDNIAKISSLLVEAARPRRIILLGSHARAHATEDSDLDIMVVGENPADRLREMVRLSRILRPLGVAVDLPVVSGEKYNHGSDTPGNVYFQAASEGKVLYEAA